MRKLALFLLVLPGCGLPCSQYASMASFANSIVPEYREYLEADESLSPDLKALKRAEVDAFERAVESARVYCEEAR